MLNLLKIFYRKYRQQRFYGSLFKRFEVKLVFDVGANIGKKTELFLKNNCGVIAIEPNATCYPALEALKKKYGRLQIEPVAVFTHGGKGQLHIGNHIEISTLSPKMMEVFTVKDKVFWEGTREVELLTLSELTMRHGSPDFLKLDCEGSDYDIIRSMTQPLRFIEFEYTKPFLSETIEALAHLSRLGNYSFQFSAYESPSLLLADWMASREFTEALTELSAQIVHGNIYCALSRP